MLVHTWNPSDQDGEEARSEVNGHPWLPSKSEVCLGYMRSYLPAPPKLHNKQKVRIMFLVVLDSSKESFLGGFDVQVHVSACTPSACVPPWACLDGGPGAHLLHLLFPYQLVQPLRELPFCGCQAAAS